MATTSTAKEVAIDIIRNLPDQVTNEEILAELYFRQQVDAGLRDMESNNLLSHEEVKGRLARWLS
mgnify:FL=1